MWGAACARAPRRSGAVRSAARPRARGARPEPPARPAWGRARGVVCCHLRGARGRRRGARAVVPIGRESRVCWWPSVAAGVAPETRTAPPAGQRQVGRSGGDAVRRRVARNRASALPAGKRVLREPPALRGGGARVARHAPARARGGAGGRIPHLGHARLARPRGHEAGEGAVRGERHGRAAGPRRRESRRHAARRVAEADGSLGSGGRGRCHLSHGRVGRPEARNRAADVCGECIRLAVAAARVLRARHQ